MSKQAYEQMLVEIYNELKAAHDNHDELLAFDLIAEINRLKSLMTVTAQS